jgi:sugar/nucleoside kinase (ribokinase family)
VIDFSKLKASWFYASSLEGNLDLLSALVNHANKNKIKMANNPGRREIAQKEKLLKVAQKLDVLIINRQEAAKLTGLLAGDKSIFKKLFSLLPKTMVVITEGAKGVWVSHPKEGRLTIEGIKVKMADSTGAGDGFGSGLVAGLAKSWDLKKALHLGVANGAAAVTKIGSKPGLITEKELDVWLEKPLKIKKIG